tara:strand:+ start:166 stop:432 length:267 start_codon:yes stop_codon:yes gene_type:complete
MKKILTKYLDLLGIQNEGYRRIFIIFNILFYIYIIYWFDNNTSPRDFNIPNNDFLEVCFLLTLSLFISIVICILIFKTFNWIIDGFKK